MQLRAGHDHRGRRARARRPQPRRGRAADQPRQQRRRRQQHRHHRRLLVDQHRRAQHHAQDHALAQPRAAAQPHRRLQRHRQEQRAQRDVEMVPVLPGHHRGQAEQRAGRDRARLAQPQPGGPVHHVAQQARQHDREQAERGAGAEDQGDRGHDQPGQRHRGVEAELDADRRGHAAGEERVAQVSDLVRDPPQVPHVPRDVAHRRAAGSRSGSSHRARSARSRRPGTASAGPGAARPGVTSAPGAAARPRAAGAARAAASCPGPPARSRPSPGRGPAGPSARSCPQFPRISRCRRG